MLKITINHQTGEVIIEAVNYQGKGCLQATKKLEENLGIIGDRKFKPEFDSSSSSVITQQNLM